jgi:hypothetical protein
MELSISLGLGGTASGLLLAAQIVNTSGVNVGASDTTGFAEIGTGYYSWNGTVADTQHGGIKFYEQSVPSRTLAFMALDQADGQNVYFAQIRHVSDITNNSDEFAVHWFKNDQPVASGALTTPSISVYNTNTGAALLQHKSMNYISTNLGAVRYNQAPMVLASGEPYLITTSGVIDSALRVWSVFTGLDLV